MPNPNAVALARGAKLDRGASRHGSARRWVRRGAFAGAAASLVLAAIPAPGVRAQDAEVPALPDTFAGAASAAGVQVELLTPPLVPVEGLLDIVLADGRGTYESANQSGRASLLYPGSGAVLGPGLLCGTFIAPMVPPEGQPFLGPVLDACGAFQYPLSVVVDSLAPDAQTEGALSLGAATDPLSVGAVGARAHAGLDATTTDAELSDLRLLGAPALGSLQPLLAVLGVELGDPALLAVDGITATTDQRIVEGRLVADAATTVTGVRLLGGLVRIGSVTSRSQLVSGGDAEPEVGSTVEVTGVEVAGTPATITEDGLVIGTNPSAGPLVQQALSGVVAALEPLGLRMTVLPTEQGEEDGVPFARAGGLLIEFTTPLAGLPPIPGPLGDLDLNGDYGLRLQLATTGVRGFADTFDDAGAGPGTGSGTPSPPPASPAPGVAAPPPGGATLAPPPVAAPAPEVAPTPTTPEVEPPVEAEPEPVGLIRDLFADRLGLVYLAFTLSALGLCLAPRFSLPARLPAAH